MLNPKKFFPFLCFCLFTTTVSATDSLQYASPDNNIVVRIVKNKGLSYTIWYQQKIIVERSFVNMTVNGKNLFDDKLRISKVDVNMATEKFNSPVPEKRSLIESNYQQVTIRFQQPVSIEFRIFNDGVAYRILTRFKDSITVDDEQAEFRFPANKKILLPLIEKRPTQDRYHTSFEELYQLKNIDGLTDASLAYTPVLTGDSGEVKVAITESDLEDYPGMFITGTGSNILKGVFAPYPLETFMTDGEFPQEIVTRRANYIARTKGTRSFPWRVLMIAAEDKDLPGNDLVYKLASPSRVEHTSWINPGKGTDEWIIGINLFNIPFKAGINTATYKYYIDFAKRFGLQRIMLDAGWSDYKNLFKINPDLDMDALAAYAKSQGIKLSMWTLCSTLDKQLDSALVQFNKWGVDFIMTDFMDRDDQPMVNFYHRIAKACADKKVMIMFHGAFPPKGFNRTWPNAVTREGVLGSEYNIWSDKPTPEHDVILPFTRMLSGPLDYEPGILDNATKEQFRPINKKVMSQGTRCHQLAMFVVYESPISIFSGNPSQALMEPAFMQLLGDIPTTWNETIILKAKVADYIVTARRKDTEWYIGGMTDWTAREMDINFSFLKDGNYEATICADGINADSYASDYKMEKITVNKSTSLKLRMAQGGGFVIKLSPKRN